MHFRGRHFVRKTISKTNTALSDWLQLRSAMQWTLGRLTSGLLPLISITGSLSSPPGRSQSKSPQLPAMSLSRFNSAFIALVWRVQFFNLPLPLSFHLEIKGKCWNVSKINQLQQSSFITIPGVLGLCFCSMLCALHYIAQAPFLSLALAYKNSSAEIWIFSKALQLLVCG